MTIPLQEGIVYGPIQSRRLGVSLGINILPDTRKVCNFNCPYCQYGWTPAEGGAAPPGTEWPEPASVASALASALSSSGPVDRLTLAGNGEPTLHPDFPEVVDRLVQVRDRLAPGARLAILSNASTLRDPAIVAALRRLDERYMKLDAGDEQTLRKLNQSPVPVEDIVQGLLGLDGVIIQSMFTRDEAGKIDNTTPGALDRWLAAVRAVHPHAVHVYTIDREPAWRPLTAVPNEELEQIAARVRAEGIEAVVF